jgi:hypothetical protein
VEVFLVTANQTNLLTRLTMSMSMQVHLGPTVLIPKQND